jgi:hypothetical protein
MCTVLSDEHVLQYSESTQEKQKIIDGKAICRFHGQTSNAYNNKRLWTAGITFGQNLPTTECLVSLYKDEMLAFFPLEIL